MKIKKQRFTVAIDADLVKQARIKAAEISATGDFTTLGDVINIALKDFFDKVAASTE